MTAFEYGLRQGLASLWRGRGSGAFAVLAIALAVTVLGALLLLTWNVEQLLSHWTSSAELSVYLRDDTTSDQRGAVEALLDGSPAVTGRAYVSKAEALARFRQEFAELAALTESFDGNPFPASIEVRVAPGAGQGGDAVTLVQRVLPMPGVADVRYDREWITRLEHVVATLRAAGLALALLMALAAAVTVAAVVRLGLHARRAELEIMTLVGAPMSYIRGPFVAEGFLQGGLGAALAMGTLWLGFALASARWGTDLRGMLDGESLEFLPLRLCTYLVLGGMLVGSAGGFVAALRAGEADTPALTPAQGAG
jgi:cell division transport system permease protein